jgi:DNA-binding transcriptional MerR regulator
MSTATTSTTYSGTEVARLAGVTYRQLDYWLRIGAIQIEDPTPGTGRPRLFTEDEVDRVINIVERVRAAHATMEDFRTGKLWKETT